MELDRKFKIDLFELCFLAEVCIPKVPIARAMFFNNLTEVYYNQMTDSERVRMFEWISPKIDLQDEDCLIFYSRFNPDNQYQVTTKFDGNVTHNFCFKMNDRFYISRNTSIFETYIIDIYKL